MKHIKQFGLIGYPLGHSWSQRFFTEKFRKENTPHFHYLLFPIRDIYELPDLLTSHPHLSGLNVTIPYKEKVIPLLDNISETAKAIGAVNTIAVAKEGDTTLLTGHNTDAYGFEKSLDIHQVRKPTTGNDRAMVLGTGGASKAVCWVLNKLGWEISLVSRNPHTDHIENMELIGYDQISESYMGKHTLIVNTTPLGMYPNTDTFPDIPYQWLNSQHILYDLVYNPETTKFLEFGVNAACKTIGGLDMLQLQAEKSFEIWMNAGRQLET